MIRSGIVGYVHVHCILVKVFVSLPHKDRGNTII